MKLTNLEIQTSHQAYPQAGEPGDPDGPRRHGPLFLRRMAREGSR